MRSRQVFIPLFLLSMISLPGFAQSGNGSLKVTSYPTGAVVFIDGVNTGTTTPMSESIKGTDRARMLGAIVGKALEPLDSGTGVILVLATLQ